MDKMYIHFIDINLDKIVHRDYLNFVPRVSDEIRLNENKFYLVEKVVWIYDEPEYPYQRANIGISKIDI